MNKNYPESLIILSHTYYKMFKDAVEKTMNDLHYTNTSITFDEAQNTVYITDTKAKVLIEIGMNYSKNIEKYLKSKHHEQKN